MHLKAVSNSSGKKIESAFTTSYPFTWCAVLVFARTVHGTRIKQASCVRALRHFHRHRSKMRLRDVGSYRLSKLAKARA